MQTIDKGVIRLLLVSLVALATGASAYEYEWPIWHGASGVYNGTYGSTCRKIVRGVSPDNAQGSLHLVFSNFGMGPNQYAHSSNGGANWQTFDIPAGALPWNGTFPCVQVEPMADRPWVAYADWTGSEAIYSYVMSQWTAPPLWTQVNDPGSGSMKQTALAISESDDPNNPAIGYMVTTLYDGSQDESHLMFYVYDTLRMDPYFSYDLASHAGRYDFWPSLDYTPGDNVHIAFQLYGTVWYQTWERPVPRNQVRDGVAPVFLGAAVSISIPSCQPASLPSIDADGDIAYCVFRGFDPEYPGQGEIYRRFRDLNGGLNWLGLANISNSPKFESSHPQCHTKTTVIWQEETPEGDTEILVAFPGAVENLSEDPPPGDVSVWPHCVVRNAAPPEPFSIMLHAAWTMVPEDQVADRIVKYKSREYVPYLARSSEYPTYLSTELGTATKSPYCSTRQGFREYQQARIDYSTTELRYVLPYLSPARYYLAEFVLYNGEDQPISQELCIGSRAVSRLRLEPGVCETLRLRLPRGSHRQNKAEVVLRRLTGPFACLANSIKVYEVDPPPADGPAGKPMQAGVRQMQAWPNPFRTACAVRFQTTEPASVTVVDAGGRLVRSLAVSQDRTGFCMAVWNGADADERPVGPGVYYCRLNTGSGATSLKVVKQ